MTNIKIILFIALSTVTMFLNAQTTLEEYNYITKGYKVQIESGLDMKKGYELSTIDKKVTSERTAELKVFYKLVTGKKIVAAYMIIYQKTGFPKEYICIPNPKSEEQILTMYWKQLHDGKNDSSARLQIVCYLLSSILVW